MAGTPRGKICPVMVSSFVAVCRQLLDIVDPHPKYTDIPAGYPLNSLGTRVACTMNQNLFEEPFSFCKQIEGGQGLSWRLLKLDGEGAVHDESPYFG